MARSRPVPLLQTPIVVSFLLAELDVHIGAIEDEPGPLTESRVMLLRQVRAEISEALPLDTPAADTPNGDQADYGPVQ